MRARPFLLVALLAAAAGVSCGRPTDPRPIVAVSVLPQAYWVDRLAGGRVQVDVLIPPGASPTTYQPSMAQMARLSSAALYLKVGHPAFPFEATWLDDLLSATPQLRVVNGSARIHPLADDPHVWLAPQGALAMAVETEAALRDVLPDHRAELATGLSALRVEIDAVDREVRDQLASRRGRSFLVVHPAWGAFARAYGLEQLAIEHESKEPDAHELAQLIARAREAGVRVVFTQPQFDPAAARMVAEEIGARVEVLDPLAYDWPANLRHVAQRLAEALPE